MPAILWVTDCRRRLKLGLEHWRLEQGSTPTCRELSSVCPIQRTLGAPSDTCVFVRRRERPTRRERLAEVDLPSLWPLVWQLTRPLGCHGAPTGLNLRSC